MSDSIITATQSVVQVVRHLKSDNIGILTVITCVVITLLCFGIMVLLCVFISRHEIDIRSRYRFGSTMLTEEQRRAVLEILFPDNMKIALHSKQTRLEETAPETPLTSVDTIDCEEDDGDINRLSTSSNQSPFPLPICHDSVDLSNQRCNLLLPLPRFSSCNTVLLPVMACENDIENNAISMDSTFLNNIEANTQCCSICLEDYGDDDNIVFSKRCTHFFHKECIMPWLLIKENIQYSCPSCRRHMINTEDLRKAASKVVGEYVHLDDTLDKDIAFSFEDSGTATSRLAGRSTVHIYANESPA